MSEKRDLIRGYATALFGLSSSEGDLERVSDELFRFGKQLGANYELRSALTDIAVPDSRKESILRELVGERVSPHTLNILNFVVSQGRARELPDIVESLVEMAAAERDKVLAEVRTAMPLDDEQKRRLAEALSRATGKSVEVKALVDPSVVGGVLAKVGDQVIDGTVRRRLEELREGLGRTGETNG